MEDQTQTAGAELASEKHRREELEETLRLIKTQEAERCERFDDLKREMNTVLDERDRLKGKIDDMGR